VEGISTVAERRLFMPEEIKVGCNIGESIRQIQAFQQVRNSKGTEATPSGWKPGKLTLKPGPDLVGKVWEVWKTDMAFD
jgi:alkyl hydroperoxide reductase subunit AhpC